MHCLINRRKDIVKHRRRAACIAGTSVFLGPALSLLLSARDSAAQDAFVRGRLEGFGYVTTRLLSESDLNPRNSVLKLPQVTLTGELRPDITVSVGKQFSVIARPRIVSYTAYVADTELRAGIDLYANTLYARYQASSTLTLSYGLQNIQWGPADLINASNRMFHINALQRTGLFSFPGRELLNIALVGKNLSAMLLVETRPSEQVPFAFGDRFGQSALAKVEYTTDDARFYFGGVAGAGIRAAPWVGQYVSWNFFEGLTLYADVSESLGSRAYYPVRPRQFDLQSNPLTNTLLAQTQTDLKPVKVLGVFGGRYDFSWGPTVRVEYLINTAGYDNAEYAQTFASALPTDPTSAYNLPRLLHPGLELARRHYLYGSLSWLNLIASTETNLVVRYLLSLEDRAGTVSAFADFALSDADVAMLIVEGTHGPKNNSLSLLVTGTAIAAYRHTW